ncbi:hypothetical protein [Archangium primigenium]|uniref:hypothetical protein n=1 Tax=[Archangium] primigenium TaxID=2792470 RepID=UPI00195B2C94|nr:hypothetical protein [Archangium primigenium]MBM7113527.1 hypothetical protein [Archangium primigenium]
MDSWTEWVGRTVGRLWEPPFKAVAAQRQARSLHAEGICLRAEVLPQLNEPGFQDVAARLAGPALVRLSTATWRGGKEWPDILGAAVRLLREPRITEQAHPGDQDLLFSTMRHMWTLLPAMFTTQVHDWLENDYFGIAPFEVDGGARLMLRLTTPRRSAPARGTRVERLRHALTAGTALLTLEARSLEAGRPPTWTPLADLFLREEVTLDPERLRFNPFLTGLGIRPTGFLHAMRPSAYRGSQEGRSEH